MRVAQLIFAGSFAGAEGVACGLTEALTPHIDESVLYLVLETRAGRDNCNRLASRARAFGIDLRVYETDRRIDRALIRQLGEDLRTDRIDLVHSHSYKGPLSLRPFTRGRNGRLGHVYTAHGFDQTSLRGATMNYAANIGAMTFSNEIIAVSDRIGRLCRQMLPPGTRNRISVIENIGIGGLPADEDISEAARQSARQLLSRIHDIPADQHWISIAARLIPIKNHDLLIDAFAAALQADNAPQARLLIAGTGPREAELRERAATAAPGLVHFLGHVDDMKGLYRASDLIALTSRSEGSPLTVIEALSHGRAVLATQVGSIPSMIEHLRTGYLIPEGDLNACSQGLLRLIQDTDLRHALAGAGRRQMLVQASPDKWAENHIRVYERAMSGHDVHSLP